MPKTPIEQLLDNVGWQEITGNAPDDDTLYATHSGVLSIGGINLRVYLLNDGRRVIESEDLERLFCLEVKPE